MTHRLRHDRCPTPASSMVVAVLIASMVVAVVLAGQAIAAARQRRSISEAMLRQYAQLAALEYSRHVRRDIEHTLLQTLNAYAHPEGAEARQAGERPCACLAPAAVDHWFEVTPSGELTLGVEPLRSAVATGLARGPRPIPGTASDAVVTIFQLPGDATRFVAVKDEPHLRPSGGQVGLIAPLGSLAPALARAYEEAPLMPDWLAGGRDARGMVHLRVLDGTGATAFGSPNTVDGSFVVNAPLWNDVALPLTAVVSMTPAFVAGLGPEHGAGSSLAVVSALVLANVLLVGVGLWQLRRERDLTRLRDDFVAGVSHEMRTPLAQIRMFSETLLLDRVRSAQERERALTIIGQESTRLGHLVDNVLRFHRRGGVAAAAPSHVVDLNVFADEVTQSFEPLAGTRTTRLVFEEGDEPRAY